MKKKHIGSDFDDLLRDEGLLEDAEATAAKRVAAILAEQEEQEWREEAAKARKVAKSKGLDQEAIDRAVHSERHGE